MSVTGCDIPTTDLDALYDGGKVTVALQDLPEDVRVGLGIDSEDVVVEKDEDEESGNAAPVSG